MAVGLVVRGLVWNDWQSSVFIIKAATVNLPVGRPKRIFARERVQELRKQGLSCRRNAREL
jgi:hypothetical protein